ncbi:type II secretion system inner membrane protein GspF [Nannocystis pusilla]|uniref:General secretion pathway protein F n=1 Tax=Nannocystis pusilla TaxID=889268 RepID=A0ABS7TL72_9BACT|nr:type II secretion system inner membrane protein GspF [Nannocystis pusilla]MBZ5708948.1 type II secretion system inner membrane protein GspF [Nannocystis pusilla]
MPAYAYTGLRKDGKTVKGVESADTVAALKANLKRAGIFLTAVSETTAQVAAGGGAGMGREVDLGALFDRVSQKTVSRTTRLLATLLCAGVTLPESLAAITEQSESRRLKGILSDIANKVNEGSSLADACARYPDVFQPLFINMVRAGEASGSLETVLLRIADFMDQQEELKGKVTSAMIYPAIMTVLSGGIIMMLMLNVVPQITEMFEGMNAQLPWNTAFLIWFSDFVAAWWYLLIAAFFGLGWLFRRWRKTDIGRATGDTILLKLPIIGDLARKLAIARFARTLATMLASGVQLLAALDIVRALLGNWVLEKVVATARDNIREGEGIAPALKRSGEFPALVTHMIAVGERSGQLEQMLTDVANAYDREVNTALTRMTALLEPLMIVVMGGSVGFIVFSIMQPIMMLNEMAAQ